MKKHLLLIFSTVLGLNYLNGQITITNAVFPSAGDVQHKVVVTNAGSVIVSPPGASQTWDYTNLVGLQQMDTVMAASTGVAAANFPTADIILPTISPLMGDMYIDVNGNAMDVVGLYGNIAGITGHVMTGAMPTFKYLETPMSFNTSTSSTYTIQKELDPHATPGSFLDSVTTAIENLAGGTTTIDSIRFTIAGGRTISGDAHGSLTLPMLAPFDVLRVQTMDTTHTSIDVKVIPTNNWISISNLGVSIAPEISAIIGSDTLITYDFWTNTMKQPLLTIVTNGAGMPITANHYYSTNTTVDFAVTTAMVAENDSMMVILDLTTAPATDVTVEVMLDMAASTATNGMDFTFTSPTQVTFPKDSTNSQMIMIPITDDTIIENDETIVLKLANPSMGLDIGADSVFNLTIMDNDYVITNDLVLTGIFDGPFSGGYPKGFEVYVVNDIPDLSKFGLGIANNGGGTDGQEYTFPAMAATAGSRLYLANDTAQFFTFFGIHADFQSIQAGGLNGDDAIELYENGTIIDLYGDPNDDGTNKPWEYLDTWVYRNCSKGPNPTFDLTEWSVGPVNGYDGQSTNATSPTPMPIDTYEPMCPANPVANNDNDETEKDEAVTINVLANDVIPNTLTSLTINMQAINGTAVANGLMDVTYTPNAGYCGGVDSFTYKICDAVGCDSAWVHVTVECPPVYPYYPIATVHTEDTSGIADSLDIDCELRGVVHGVNMRSGGLQFTIIDATGGMSVFSTTVVSNYTVEEGDSVHIKGFIGQYRGLTQIEPDEITLISSGNDLQTPMVVTTLDETTESNLVKITSVTIVDTTEWTNSGSGFNVRFTNGTDTFAVRIDSDVDIFGTTISTSVYDITGIGGQFDSNSPYSGGYQILPRYLNDIQLVSSTKAVYLEDKVSFMPNPANTNLLIETEVALKAIQITNVLGQPVFTIQNPSAQNYVDVSSIASGLYMIVFVSERGILTKELLIQH